jgi:hypothetical protein
MVAKFYWQLLRLYGSSVFLGTTEFQVWQLSLPRNAESQASTLDGWFLAHFKLVFLLFDNQEQHEKMHRLSILNWQLALTFYDMYRLFLIKQYAGFSYWRVLIKQYAGISYCWFLKQYAGISCFD